MFVCVCVGRGRKFRMEWNQKEFRVYVCGMNQESYLKKSQLLSVMKTKNNSERKWKKMYDVPGSGPLYGVG